MEPRASSARRTWSVVVATLLVAGCSCGSVSPAPSPPSPPPSAATPGAGVLWTGDAETGDLSQFQDTPWNDVGGTAPQVVQDVVRAGRYAVRLGIRGSTDPGDGICCGSRNELVPRFRDLVPGDDLYFGFSVHLARGFPVDAYWQVITQFKQNFDGSPPLSLNVERGDFLVEGGYGHPDGPDPFSIPVGPAVTGRWIDWVIHVKFSSDPSAGFVEVWRDGALVLPRFSPATGTLYPGPSGTDSSYLKTGYYRAPEITRPGTIYFDEWRIATSFVAARP